MGRDIKTVNGNWPFEQAVSVLNDNDKKLDGKFESALFNKNEINQIYADLGLERQFERDLALGSDLSTYLNWQHVKSETGYSIWKYSVNNYRDNSDNSLYFDNITLEYRGVANSELAASFDKVFDFDGNNYNDATLEAASEEGTPFTVLRNSDDDILYIGHNSPFSGIDFEFETLGMGLSLVIEYSKGTGNWQQVQFLNDETNNFSRSGRIAFLMPQDFAADIVNSENMYWIRIKTTINPVIVPSCYFIQPLTSVINLLSLNSEQILSQQWAWCYFNGFIYLTIKNSGISQSEGIDYIASNSSQTNKQNFFISNHIYTISYEYSHYIPEPYVTSQSYRPYGGESSLNLKINQGRCLLNGTFYSHEDTVLSLSPNEANIYVFIDETGTITTSLTGFQLVCYPIAEVVTNSSGIMQLTDRRVFINRILDPFWVNNLGTLARPIPTTYLDKTFLPGSSISSMTRPALSTTPIMGEIRGCDQNNTNNENGFLRISAGGGSNTANQSYIDLSGYSAQQSMNKNIALGIGNTEIARITENGVGIGVTFPQYKLDVLAPNSGMNLSGSNSRIYFNEYRAVEGSQDGVNLHIGESYQQILLRSSGNVGIGTMTPAYKLHVYTQTGAGLKISRDITHINDLNFQISGGDGLASHSAKVFLENPGDIGFRTRNTGDFDLVLKSNGNLGVGTTNPETKLEVNGIISGTENSTLKYLDSGRNISFWDPTFESGVDNWGTINDTSITQSNEESYLGNYSMRIQRLSLVGAGGVAINLGTGLMSGTKHTLYGFYKTNMTGFVFKINLNFNATEPYVMSHYREIFLDAVTEWTPFSITLESVELDPGSTNFIWLANNIPSTNAVIYFDNLHFVEGSMPMQNYPNIISLPDGLSTTIYGKLGINKRNAEETLDVNGSILLPNDTWLKMEKTDGYNEGILKVSATNSTILRGSPDIYIQTFSGASWYDRIHITDMGNVGIKDNSPSKVLTVNGDTYFYDDANEIASDFEDIRTNYFRSSLGDSNKYGYSTCIDARLSIPVGKQVGDSGNTRYSRVIFGENSVYGEVWGDSYGIAGGSYAHDGGVIHGDSISVYGQGAINVNGTVEGDLIGVYGNVYKTGGTVGGNRWAGYFDGNTYISDYLGIGTIPSFPLHIKSSSDIPLLIESTDTASFLALKDSVSNHGIGSWNGSLYFRKDILGTPSTHMMIDPTGKVGVGTTSPSEKLEVIGTAKATYFVGDGSGLVNVDSLWDTNANGIHFNSGNIGIGVTLPQYSLDVSAPNSGVNIAGANSRIYFGGYRAIEGSQDGVNLQFGESYQNIFLRCTQNVGLGTMTPNAKLHIQSESTTGLKISRTITHINTLNVQISGGDGLSSHSAKVFLDSPGDIGFRTSSAGNFELILKDNGRVGIGITNPDANLHVGSTNERTEANPHLKWGYGGYFHSWVQTGEYNFRTIASDSAAANLYIGMKGGTSATGKIIFQTGATASFTNKVAIDKFGQIGIGTTEPSAMLHISKVNDPILKIVGMDSNDNASIQLLENLPTPYYGFELKYNGDDNRFEINRYDSSATAQNAFTIDRANGNVGIGTNQPDFGLHLKDRKLFQETSSDANHAISLRNNVSNRTWNLYQIGSGGNPANGFVFEFFNGSGYSPRMVIDELGYVGVGTTGPTALLHINQSSNTDWAVFVKNNGGAGKGLLVESASGDSTPVLQINNNYSNPLFNVLSDGRVSTGGELAPDCTAGGITINLTSAFNKVPFTIKNPNVSHGFTNFCEDDTFLKIQERTMDYGGTRIMNFTDTGNAAVNLEGYAQTESTSTSTISTSTVRIVAGLRYLDYSTSLSPDGNLVTVENMGTTTHILKGSGDIHTYTGGHLQSYDNENDIVLAETVRGLFDGKKVLKKYKDRLEELGIMKQGFMSHQKMLSLNLGAIGQLFNMIRELAKKVGIDKEGLLAMAKQYA